MAALEIVFKDHSTKQGKAVPSMAVEQDNASEEEGEEAKDRAWGQPNANRLFLASCGCRRASSAVSTRARFGSHLS